MRDKLRVAILFGGQSAEHEVSIQSAKNVFDAIDRDKYDVLLIAIDKDGHWRTADTSAFLLDAADVKTPRIDLGDATNSLTLAPGTDRQTQLVAITGSQPPQAVDVVFPVLHGPYGEDGTVQGLLKLAQVPFVGAGVLGSAVGMDKDVTKRLLREAGVLLPNFLVVHRTELANLSADHVAEALGLPCFVKPANLGSSVGIAKVHNHAEFDDAIRDAFAYDRKIIVEECIQGREIECAVLGNDEPIASVPGEILPRHEFYSYEAKYLDEDGAALEIPADLPDPLTRRVQELAVKTFKVLCCEGMARVDFFLRHGDELLVNEINTIPGFTTISMYPKLWAATGVSYTELIDRLIQLAIERFDREQALRTSYGA